MVGLISVAPPGPAARRDDPLTPSGGWAVLIVAALIASARSPCCARWPFRFALPRVRTRGPGRDTAPREPPPGLLVVACVVAVLLWLVNPYAALLVVPGLHLWLPALSPDLRLRVPCARSLCCSVSLPLAAVPSTTPGADYTPLSMVWMLYCCSCRAWHRLTARCWRGACSAAAC